MNDIQIYDSELDAASAAYWDAYWDRPEVPMRGVIERTVQAYAKARWDRIIREMSDPRVDRFRDPSIMDVNEQEEA